MVEAFVYYSENEFLKLSESDYLCYKEVQSRTSRIVRYLKTRKLIKGDLIAICTSKTVDSILIQFGAILNNNPYIPLDILAPEKRLIGILEDSCPKAIVVDEISRYKLSLESFSVEEIFTIPETNFSLIILDWKNQTYQLPIDLVYILYTSGSTGIPKGVMITHENAVSFIEWASSVFQFSQNDVFSSVAPLHFDLSVFDVFVALRNGAKVVLFDEKAIRNPLLLAELIEQKGITVWYSTPTVLMLLMRYGKIHRRNHKSIKRVFYAGEVFPEEQLNLLKQQWPTAELFNLYGPTETNVCTWFKIPNSLSTGFSSTIIGKSCSHAQCEILNHDDPSGLVGELAVSGASVSPGYLNRPELNSSKFYKDNSGIIWYRTGDWVEKLDSGDFKFLGRIDRMVKRRGYRIELDEIEATISNHPKVLRAAINSKINSEGDVSIYAFIKASNVDIEINKLKAFVMERLPSYMLPDQWIFVDQLPLTSTQKVNYEELKLMIN